VTRVEQRRNHPDYRELPGIYRMFRKLLKALLCVARKCGEVIRRIEQVLESCAQETEVAKDRIAEEQTSTPSTLLKRVAKNFLNAADALGIANLFGADIPPSVPGIAAKVCSFISTKMSAALSLCSSPVALWALGLSLAFVAGEILTRAVG
jgi:hypothetical protein